ncbi:5,10-methylenetetrahydrofolate reductase [Sporomusa ovata DSM 2662]|uniref:Methylenetetrahydrofolate reductase n=1 Tax=Sporomusa ovata TaxID=2378 RepID=A0A0U1KY41_9FIRM|nr:methylenetetrahydrofolate reductase [NAD(P)H] [Sporomusa ovata]EQB28910.1 5,10-methylenetetrahydrofolate reductase [Sporomusa ovata DSM 2662]CQR72340.1 5,10-methylenetetrahydrofolate reductase [Sporomusa ovata]
MKITEIFKKGKPVISFEFFPARTEELAEKFNKTIDELLELKPDFVTVTFGAGGSTKDGSYELVKKFKKEKKQELIAYLAAFALRKNEITTVLDHYKDLGIENIFSLRGDPPKNTPTDQVPADSFRYASELTAFIRQNYNFCLGVAGYPEGHIEAPSFDKDIENLKHKVDQGAEFIITQYFYDNAYFLNFVERCRKSGITIPILPGIMSVYSIKMMEMLAVNCGANIPDKLRQGIAELPEGDTKALINFGIKYAINQCEELIKEGVSGLHFYTMDRSESTVGVVKGLKDKGLLRI